MLGTLKDRLLAMIDTADDRVIVCNFGRWPGTTLATAPAHANWVEVGLVDWRGHRRLLIAEEA